MIHNIQHPSGAYRLDDSRFDGLRRKAVTLFSGVGGSSLALRNLGFDVYAHDFMPEAVQSLRANGFMARQCDVRDIDWDDPEYADTDVLEGGPPCQPFSQSHDGLGRYDERDMIPEFLRAVAGLLPKLFVMEEVQTLTWKRHADYLAMVEDHMRALGYRVEHRVLNAAKFGLAQARKRLFVVGVREDVAQDWERFVTADEVIAWPAQDREPKSMASALGWSGYTAFHRNQQVPDPRAHVVPKGTPMRERVEYTIGTGEDAVTLRTQAFLHPALDWPYLAPAPTVVGTFRPEVAAKPGYRVAGDPPRQATPGSVVTTLRERLILQDFPADWIVCGSEAKQALQVGNSVPVGLMQELIDLNIA